MDNRVLLIYLNESDFESVSTSEDWISFITKFHFVSLIMLLKFSNEEDFDLDRSIYHQVKFYENTEEIAAEFLSALTENLSASRETFIQIISHGNRDGLAVKADDLDATRRTFISYNSLQQAIRNPERTYLSLMTVCESANTTALQETDLIFLATTYARSVSTEAINDSIKLFDVIGRHGLDKSKLADEFSNSLNRYKFALANS